jgi:hypothetical protein
MRTVSTLGSNAVAVVADLVSIDRNRPVPLYFQGSR